MIHISGVSKQYGSKILFEGAEAHIGNRSRIALIGANGSGKSTLIRMLLGQEHPDGGQISRFSHLAIGHLAQEAPRMSGRTVLGETMRLDGRREELVALRHELEAKFADGGDGASESELDRYGRVLEELEHLDEYRLESRAKEILSGMGFKPSDFDRKVEQLSGGWLMRVALSRVLLMDPDLLLLDEPTNHLDLESLLWLEEFLGSYRGALLLVSHDTAFLNRMVREVIEIDQRKLWVYRGNLDSFVTQKEERLTLLRSQHAGQQAKAAELEAFIARFGAKATKASQAQSRAKQLEKLKDEMVELPEERSTIRFRFPPASAGGREVVTARKASLTFPVREGGGAPRPIFRDLDWVILRGSRVAIVGVNGAGKTTLLRMVAGDLAPTAGSVALGHDVRVGYYAQHQAEGLGLDNTILEELWAVAPGEMQSRIRSVAGAFLFSGDAVEKKCRVLSGGEKARVALAKLLLKPSNFLLLDEPTNHLDAESRGVLLQALQGYEGTLCLISHDREFVGPLVTSVLEIVPSEAPGAGSQVVPLLGSYDDYIARKLREAAERSRGTELSKAGGPGGAAAPSKTGTAGPSAGASPSAAARPSNNKRMAWEAERDKTEKEIARLERRQAEIHAELAAPATYEDKALVLKLSEEQRGIAERLSAGLARWEEICGLLGG